MKLLQDMRGSAFLITICLIAMLGLIAISSVDYSTTDLEVSFNQQHEEQAFYAAESGLERALSALKANSDWRAGFNQQEIGNQFYEVAVHDSTTKPGLLDTLQIRSIGMEGEFKSVIEVLLVPAGIHPLFENAIYAGNSEEYDPTADTQSYSYSMDFGGTGANSDIINGDVWFNGNTSISGQASINGVANVGGTLAGNAPTGGYNAGADYLAPPDLQQMNYETTADFKVNSSAPWDAKGQIQVNDPRHIFVKDFRTDLGITTGYSFNNTNYFLGDPWESSNIEKVSVSVNGNHKTYFVDGNLWIEPQGQSSKLFNSPSDGTQITIVAKGNIYFSDDFLYDDTVLDAVAFIAMTDGESFTDMNGDNQYDAGEPLLHDDGDGTYEGPIEGSGNVMFGDPNGGPLGHVHGYIYAENNFEDHVVDDSNNDGKGDNKDDPLNFEVTGMFSAGNLVRINRDFNGKHAQMKVNYDDRLVRGTIQLPGLPPLDVGAGDWMPIAWREVYE